MFGLRSRRVVTPAGTREAVVLIEGRRIRAVSSPRQAPAGVPVEDVVDHALIPGVVDSHVHVNEPGRTDWEGFRTATRAALAGGVTTLVDMPLNSSPVTVDPPALREKRLAAESNIYADCGFHGGLIPTNAGSVRRLVEQGVCGVKAFLIDSGIAEFPAVGRGHLEKAMSTLCGRTVPLLAHAELAREAREPQGDPRVYSTYLATRPPAMELAAVELLIDLCRKHQCAVHIVHLATGAALPALRAARSQGLPITVETCPHYLTFCAEEIADGDTRFKCAPPIRSRLNREELWEGLRTGAIDFVVSDHSPSPPALKLPGEGDFLRSWGGISSLQYSLPALWTQARARGFDLSDLVGWMCSGPAALLGPGHRKGSIAAGCDADLVVFDTEAVFQPGPSLSLHRHKISPYDGRDLKGVVRATYLRGSKVFDEGRVAEPPRGELLDARTGRAG